MIGWSLSLPVLILCSDWTAQLTTVARGRLLIRMLLKAAINGGRTRNDHAAAPVSPKELAADGVECLKAGAGAVHLHVRSTSDNSRKESLHKEDVERTIRTVLTVAPKERIGIS